MIIQCKNNILSALLVGAMVILFSSCQSSEGPNIDTSNTTNTSTIIEINSSSSDFLTSSHVTIPSIADTYYEQTDSTEPPIVFESNINPLSGLTLDDTEFSNLRPYAFVVNNLRAAATYQYGLSSADIIYEYETEGGITRFLALYYNPKDAFKLGSIRSARKISVNIAMGWDAIYFHAGGSPDALDQISKYSYTHIDGVYEGSVYFRDNVVSANIGSEHSLYTDSKNITNVIANLDKKGQRITSKSGSNQRFFFYPNNQFPENASIAIKLTTRIGSYSPYFTYNKNTNSYVRYQYGAVHTDRSNNTNLDFKNILILAVPSSLIAGDSAGRRNFEDVGNGRGVYATNGVYIEIAWSKSSESAPLILFNLDGSPLYINKGKTFVSYINGMQNVTISTE